ncbi:MAG: aromatic ring hydroxylase [Candidatus Magasanikbacteria bacterium CG10_big_fil_rev_8_21_14_0_10_43_6]|uniref:Aromatic ring hydroxylase n=1 Tax=Candidatus Magasanikbacteria bacterium CG10_big_fil_rev_8_21_14_0_10_43_6 TaxID=1974650 RepID=A0A2M6W1E2_9BACT|nr:MAG: aromatic ring hydroxylase [Candidatus Magasanikbacteria bacterium CG10_big_fil_rev_8_21_14_0_10_43_6]
MLTKEAIIEKLETVIDPHIGIDIWTLGFIYEITIRDEKSVHILMTLTTPMCPMAGSLKQDITYTLKDLGVETVEVETTFDPPWKPPPKVKEMFAM